MQKVSPCLWFDGNAEEAVRFYVSLLPDSRIDAMLPYTVETPGGRPGDLMAIEFTLAGSTHEALNGGPFFRFTPAISLMVACDDQAEIDRLWAALLEGGAAMQCGWLTDRFGVTWQIVPRALTEMLKDPDKEKVRRMTEAMLTMVKLEIEPLRRAFEGTG